MVLSYSNAVKFLFYLSFATLVLNIKIGPVYISFLASSILAAVGLFQYFANSILNKKKFIICSIFLFYILFVNTLINFDKTFLYLNLYLTNSYKLLIIIFVCNFTYRCAKKSYFTSLDFLRLFIISSFIASIRYLVSNYDGLEALDSNLNRPYPDWIGGYNQFSAMLAISIGLLICNIVIFKTRYLKIIMLFFLAGAMAVTMSRGGGISLFFAVNFYLLIKSPKSFIKLNFKILLMLILLFLLKDYYQPINSIFSRYIGSFFSENVIVQTSGRNVIWAYTLDQLFYSSNIITFLFGFGIGSFRHNFHTDPHNVFLHIFWEHGLVTLFTTLAVSVMLYLNISWKDSNNSSSGLVGIKFALIVLGINFFVEGFQYSTQTGWLVAIFAGYAINEYVVKSIALK